MKILAIIPARGGSKGIPGKNIYPILGKPLLQYTIEAAIESKKLYKICVSSEDPAIIGAAEKYEQIKIHFREHEIAGDTSPVSETIQAVVNEYSLIDNLDAILLLQPTSPIRTGKQIDEAIELFERSPRANSLISVCPMDDVHPARMYWKKNDFLNPILAEFEETRRQDIPKAWYRNGSIYIVRTKAFERYKSVMIKPSIGYEMPTTQLLNIDDPRDLLIAEPLINAWQKGTL